MPRVNTPVKGVLKSLEKQYRTNPRNRAFQIEIKILSYRDIFNHLDPSPLKRRDLDETFITYLDESSEEIPLKFPIEICIHCPERIKEGDMEERILLGVRGYYQFNLQKLKAGINQLLKDALIFLTVSVISLFVAFYLSRKSPGSYFGKIAVEGFIIGGWVFLWEALALVAFKNREQRKDKKRLLRIIRSEIRFVYPDI